MATNHYFSQKVKSEQLLYEDIIIESIRMYGQDVYYLPRDLVNEDVIFGDDVPSRFNSSYKVEVYIENVEGFDGEGDLFTKFGIEIRDQASFIIARRRWDQTVSRYDNEIVVDRPAEGDLLYLPLSKSMFQIMHVEHEQPFYQLSNLPVYRLRCELFEYSGEDIETGVEEIDDIENLGYKQVLSLADSAEIDFVVGSTVSQLLGSGATVTGEVVSYNDSDNILTVTQIGSDDSDFHLFTTGDLTATDTNGATFKRTITSVDEQLNQVNAQNDDFDTQSDFIDFTETNPFGDPR